MGEKVEEQLKEVGSKLETLPSTKDAIIKLLKQAAVCLPEIDQSPPASVIELMQPFLNSIVKPELLKHQDRDVKLLVASCICEITRITAPEAPYSDDVLKDIFHLIVGTFSGLSDTGGPSFGRRVTILETVAKYRSCVVMLDLECDDLVNKMFSTFFEVARDDHQESVLSSMQTIMAALIEESEDVREDLLLVILSVLGRNRNVPAAARRLAMNVVEQCAEKLEAGIKQYIISSISGDNKSLNDEIDYHEVIFDIYRCAPHIISGVVPYLVGELLTDQLETRVKAIGLAGDLFALPYSTIGEEFQPIFSEFLKRLTDRVVSVRMSVLERVKSCLLSNPSRAEAAEIISALTDRLLDYDENVRKKVVEVICDVACHALNCISVETIKLVAERVRDKSLLVKRYTVERLAEIFRVYCQKSIDGSVTDSEFDWVPAKILRCLYDKDFRLDTIESVLCGLFPTELSVKDRAKNWVRIFSIFDKVEVKAFEKILEQKQRLQLEMQKYLSLRQVHQDGDAPEIQKKILFCFRVISRSFADPAKAEENFQILEQLKDVNIWKILTNLLDPNTSFRQACSSRDDLLKILGEKHRLYDFLSNLSVKCSYVLFNKELVKEFLLEAAAHKSTGNTQFTQSSMDILVILARFSPLLLGGAEEELISFLKDDNVIIKEGALHVLARAGGTIREQLTVSSSSIDLILERFCLEGSRKHAKYAVHALAAITKDDGLKSLSVLYKKLVEMLEEKRHLPAVLQSLGCIAETAMPVFETRENDVQEFIKRKIVECSNKAEESEKATWDDRSEVCLLKIYGLKTLVKSYLPTKDAQLRPGIDNLFQLLRNILLFGEISKDIESSSVDKAHLRLASAKAVLRLSRQWDDKIPVDVFHLTLRTPEIAFPQARKIFLNKVYQYVKERLLDPKYACAFLFNITSSAPQDFEEEKQNLSDIIQMHYQAKSRQLSVQSDVNNSAAYPEYILPYLVHTLAHHSCPDIDECKDVQAFEPVYRQLYLFLSLLMHKDEDAKSEASINKEKETICTIASLFQSIKCSEDVVNAAKSKNSHAISELGLLITKCIAKKEDDFQTLASLASLPAVLYKSYEKKADDSLENEGKTWLADESVLAHFKSLKLETNETPTADNAEDDNHETTKENDEANEVPLGKMLKQLKAQGTKGGKIKKNKSQGTKAENDVDILKVVREINLDNLGLSGKFEASNGHKHSPSEKIKSESEHKKDKKRKASAVASVPVPKKRRSSLPQTPLKASMKTSMDGSSLILKGKKSVPKEMVENSESDDLASSVKKRRSSFSSEQKRKDSDMRNNGKKSEAKDSDDGSPLKHDDSKTSAGSTKKRKRKSISGLAKRSTMGSGADIEEYIGHRVKVWWPLDKKFYEGTIKSYDPIKNKHVILYDDGDIEVLRLDKERWELVDKGGKKKSKSSKRPESLEVSARKSSIPRQHKSPKIVKGKRTPKKNTKFVKKEDKGKGDSDVSKEKVDSDISKERKESDVSDVEPTISSEGEKKRRGTKKIRPSLTDSEESDKEMASTSMGKDLEDTAGSPEESDGETKTVTNADVSGDMETSQDAIGGSEKEESYSEVKGKDEANESSKDEVDREKLESEDDHDTNDVVGKTSKDSEETHSESSNSSDEGDAEMPEDEPLINWKAKVGKSAPKSS